MRGFFYHLVYESELYFVVPVSYTHLDVYKRQDVDRNGESYYIGRKGKQLDFYSPGNPAIHEEPAQHWWHGIEMCIRDRSKCACYRTICKSIPYISIGS